jgi:indolepyruvate ferredoxin oxidoreductase
MQESPRTAAGGQEFSLDDRYVRDEGRIYLTGIHALVRMLVERARHDRAAGLDTGIYVSGYQGSPLAGYDLELARRRELMSRHQVVHHPGLNEELAATAVAGTQIAEGVGQLTRDGVVGVWYGKAPGLDRATDALRHANLMGASARGGAVALVGDDPAAKSSTVPCASELALADLDMPTFYPADPAEILEHGRHAIELSRAAGLWSAMKIATNVADGSATADAAASWHAPDLSGLPGGLTAYSHRPHARLLSAQLAELERSLQLTRMPIAQEYIRRSGLNRIAGAGDARIGIVAAGKTYLDLRQALRALGLADAELELRGIRLLQLGVIHPVEPSVIIEFAAGLSEIIVVEEKRSFIETAVKGILYGRAGAPVVTGKRSADGSALYSPVGELGPDDVAAGLARRLADHGGFPSVQAWRERPRRERALLTLAPRTPYFCSGCPHNSSTKVADGTLVGAGIGCHAMVLFMPPEQVGNVTGLTQMGGEGAQWIGMSPFVKEDHFVQNLGDGTFAHSGSLAVRAAVAAGVNVTFKILYNSAVAMTGGQDPVGAIPIGRLIGMLRAENVRQIVVTTDQPRKLRRTAGRGADIRHRDELIAVQRELAARAGVTVLIHDQECAAEKRRKRRRGKMALPAQRVLINERVCEGCGDCGKKSNCLSVQPVATEFGRKTQISQSSCNLDFSCLNGDCPSFITVTPGPRRAAAQAPAAGGTLPDPDMAFGSSGFTMRITGIGGTGVTTLSQILATAAVIDGGHVRGLDQTGLAQKGGAVVSDLKITAEPLAGASKLADGECDLYLGCDSLVATDPLQLKVADAARTVAVVSTSETPTGHMVVDTALAFPAAGQVRAAIDPAARRAHYLDARAIAADVLHDDQYANVVLAGAAYQAGALPISSDAIERAITLNGVAVQRNLEAFAAGRRAQLSLSSAAAPAAGGAAPVTAGSESGVFPAPEVFPAVDRGTVARLTARVDVEAGSDVARLVHVRAGDLVSYQSESYARQYVDFVELVRRREQAAAGGRLLVTEAVARNLYKLMAYKDEYEVARLSIDPAVRRRVEEQFGAGSSFSYRLHPPVLRGLGMKRKISLGRWSRPGFRMLYAARRLRGTRADLFGYARVRRVERQLIRDYRQTIEGVLDRLAPASRDVIAELAAAPDMIRGYERIKLDNVERYRQRTEELLRLLTAEASTGGVRV